MIKIVAEVGCNHNGNISIAKTLLKQAKLAGANAAKFQLFIAAKFVSQVANKAEYQVDKSKEESQLMMLKKLELSHPEYLEIVNYAQQIDMEVFATAFDDSTIDFLSDLGQRIWKIPSGEINNLPYLEKIRDVVCPNKEIILSTGMSTMEEISTAVRVLQDSKDTKFTVLHCNTEYPTIDRDMNLRALHVLKSNFPNWQIGLSDHSLGITAAITAVSMGISFIEKHFTLDNNMPGPDHKASITPVELKKLCTNIRRAEIMLGKEEKFVTPSENKNKWVARRSIVAKKNIKKDDIFSEHNITCKRPGYGISPMHWYHLIGRKAEKDFQEDELIVSSDIEWENKHE